MGAKSILTAFKMPSFFFFGVDPHFHVLLSGFTHCNAFNDLMQEGYSCILVNSSADLSRHRCECTEEDRGLRKNDPWVCVIWMYCFRYVPNDLFVILVMIILSISVYKILLFQRA